MVNSNLLFLLLAVAVSLAFGEKDSSEIRDPMPKPTARDDKSDSGEPNSGEKIVKHFPNRQRRPNKAVLHSEQADDGAAIPHLGFSPHPGQSIYLSDPTGEYDVRLRNFQQPSKFHAVLGAISAHILNQRNSQEYVPYPPNGDPRNYPAYRGDPRGTEPPAVRAYERAGKTNYDVPPWADFDRRSPSRLLSPEDYRRPVPHQFRDSDTDLSFFHGEQLRPDLRPPNSFYEYK